MLCDGRQVGGLLGRSYPLTLHRKSLVIPAVRRAAHMLTVVDACWLPISEPDHVVFPFGHDLAIDTVDGAGVGEWEDTHQSPTWSPKCIPCSVSSIRRFKGSRTCVMFAPRSYE